MLSNCLKIFIIIFLLNPSALPDVIVKWNSKHNFGNTVTTFSDRTEYIKDSKSRNEIETKIESPIIISESGGTEKTVEITLLDRGLHWYLMPSQKKYIEKDLSLYKLDRKESQIIAKEEAKKYTWTIKTERSEKKKKINGYESNKITFEAIGLNNEDIQDTVFMVFGQWRAKDIEGIEELNVYHQNYKSIMGGDEVWTLEGIYRQHLKYGDAFRKVNEKLSETTGYPVKTEIKIESTLSTNPLAGLIESKSEKGRELVWESIDELKKIEIKDIQDNKFEIPEDYVKKEE